MGAATAGIDQPGKGVRTGAPRPAREPAGVGGGAEAPVPVGLAGRCCRRRLGAAAVLRRERPRPGRGTAPRVTGSRPRPAPRPRARKGTRPVVGPGRLRAAFPAAAAAMSRPATASAGGPPCRATSIRTRPALLRVPVRNKADCPGTSAHLGHSWCWAPSSSLYTTSS